MGQLTDKQNSSLLQIGGIKLSPQWQQAIRLQ